MRARNGMFFIGRDCVNWISRVKISVIIPTYKKTKLLLRCLKALLQQNFSKNDYEIIIISDGFDDDTEQSLMPFFYKPKPSLHYYPMLKKSGAVNARNIGWQFAIGELVAFTDDSCIPDVHWLSSLWNAYLTNRKNTKTNLTIS